MTVPTFQAALQLVVFERDGGGRVRVGGTFPAGAPRSHRPLATPLWPWLLRALHYPDGGAESKPTSKGANRPAKKQRAPEAAAALVSFRLSALRTVRDALGREPGLRGSLLAAHGWAEALLLTPPPPLPSAAVLIAQAAAAAARGLGDGLGDATFRFLTKPMLRSLGEQAADGATGLDERLEAIASLEKQGCEESAKALLGAAAAVRLDAPEHPTAVHERLLQVPLTLTPTRILT